MRQDFENEGEARYLASTHNSICDYLGIAYKYEAVKAEGGRWRVLRFRVVDASKGATPAKRLVPDGIVWH